ncbi:hypothetical protein ACHHRT_13815 [Desulfurivibrio sp. D14AmB]|uniref:hypothetical protein n=1 Tax=Desulfurivibrio sp. D14AmB TaxID=3374370 RepID=UPI00376EBA5E
MTTTTTAGRTISLVLDANGRISQSRPAGLLGVGYHYDLRGRLSSITQGGGAQGRYLDFTYNSQGYPAATRYAYHPATGRLSGITTPENNTLAFTYDGFLPLTQSWSGEINGSVARGYDNNFQLQSLNVNGQSITYSYDSDGLPIRAGGLTLERDPANGFLTGTGLAGVATTQAYNGFGEITAFTAAHEATELFSWSG